MDIFQEIKSLHLPKGKYIVGGGAALECYGIRKATDIDIAVTRDVYKKLRSEGWKERVVNGNKGLVKGRVDLAIGYMCGNKKISTSVLTRAKKIIKGIPVMNIKQIVKIKKTLNRKKDQKDLKLVSAFLDKYRNPKSRS